MTNKALPVVFTDLDGTFLDHHTYDYSPALPAVKRLKSANGKLFAVSSKTLAEQKALFDHTDIFDGYIAENGGVLCLDGELEILGPSLEAIRGAKLAIESAWGSTIPSFQKVHLQRVMQSTGLPEADARLACERLCSDPLIFPKESKPSPEQFDHFVSLAEQFGTRLVHGGRFATLCGHHAKGEAIESVINKFIDAGCQLTSLALGDSENDLDMLQVADSGVLICNEAGYRPGDEKTQGLTLQKIPGPEGWCLSVNAWLDHHFV